MTNVTINDYIELGTLDRTLLEHKQKYAMLLRQKESNQNILLKEKETFKEQERLVHQQKMSVLSLEKEIKALDQEIALKKRRRESVTSHKEFASIEHELALLEQKRELLDERLLQDWETLETHAADFKKQAQLYEKNALDKQKELIELGEKEANEQAVIITLEEQRNKALAKLPVEWVERYKTLQSRVPNPYVPVINGICSGCSYAVLQKDLIDLRAHRMVHCKECYRLLYQEQS